MISVTIISHLQPLPTTLNHLDDPWDYLTSNWILIHYLTSYNPLSNQSSNTRAHLSTTMNHYEPLLTINPIPRSY